MSIARPTIAAIVDNVRPASPDAIIEARDVVKTYDTGRLQVQALRGVNLTINRGKNRARTDRGSLYAVLDAGLICHLAFVADGAPVVIPTGYGRDGDTHFLVMGYPGLEQYHRQAYDLQILDHVTFTGRVPYPQAQGARRASTR